MAKFITFFVVFIFCMASIQSRKMLRKDNHVPNDQTLIFDVLDYGAKGDGYNDDTKAFSDAWNATCQSSNNSPVMHIPHGKKFILQPVIFNGEYCTSKNITVQVEGEIVAPSNPNEWKCYNHECTEWIKFQSVNGLFIHGYGTINGQGENWWKFDCDHLIWSCEQKATGLVIMQSENVHIKDLNFKDSPQMHIAFESSSWIYASNLTIHAPGDSPNTDGIHLQNATNIFINNSSIGTGDDCISISNGSSHVNITGVTCGPGHGISIGSLGKDGKEETVEFIHVKNSTFIDTQNGVRIKTWQGGKGHARNMIFEDIISQNASNPIIIDQYYCPLGHCSNQTWAVNISNIRYSNIRGTSETQVAVHLACSNSIPCTDIWMNDINLLSSTVSEEGGSSHLSESGNNTISYCLNARGYSHGKVFPSVPCLENV